VGFEDDAVVQRRRNESFTCDAQISIKDSQARIG
jgi:hypothetical protein